MNLLLQASQVMPDSAVGGKARSLASLTQARMPIPGWFVILPAAFDLSLNAERREQLLEALSADDVAAALDDLCPAAEVTRQVEAAYAALCPEGEPVAVRSSAADEDSAALSFAGQLESYLFVTGDKLPQRLADVWRSGFTDRIIAYRRNAGLDPLPAPPAVIVQKIVDGDVSGVAFSSDPVSGRRGLAVVAGVWGLGQALVSGEADADTWHVGRDGAVLKRSIATKQTACRRDPEQPAGVTTVPVEEDLIDKATLTDEQVAAVAQLARDAESYFGRPQDIEWTTAENALYLLQSRPITTLMDKPDPDDPPYIWDNTNIIESYSGVTTPLTFSFIRRCYEQVYRQFCQLMRVPDQVIEDHAEIFACMLGLLNGRVYYNLLNGYRVLTLLPGYKLNRKFTEEMLGFRETLPDEIQAELEQAAVGAKGRDLLRLSRALFSVSINFLTIERRVKTFYKRLHTILPEKPIDVAVRSPDELAKLYRQLETELLHHWDAPTVNDFFAAIFHGSLRRLTQRWLVDETGSLHNDLLCGNRRLISMEIAGQIQKMAELAARYPDLVVLLRDGTRAEIEERLADVAELEAIYLDYLDRFGDRCLDELKLESNTVRDDPMSLFRAVGGYAELMLAGTAPASNVDQRILADAESRAKRALAAHPLRRWIFHWVLRQTRRRVRCRENLRFERTRAFGMARRIAAEMGRRFASLDLIKEPRDIFYLTIDEMLAVVEGTEVTMDLKALVALRRAEFDRYRAMPAPADRFQTRGIPYIGDQFAAPTVMVESAGQTLQGIGCCPGIVRGPVTIVEDPRDARIAPGTIVVACRTDPGWVMIFPAATGLLVERGSMLSHSAIVAREMGLPTIVSIPGLTHWLKEGDLVEMNGASGVVTRIGDQELAA
jgi:phosphohistidine swiveling domain-containing protein